METKNINEVIANLSVEQLAGMIDHTFLKPFGTAENTKNLWKRRIKRDKCLRNACQ